MYGRETSGPELRDRRAHIATAVLIVLLSTLGLGGCSSPAPDASAAQKSAMMNFDLTRCQQMDVGLYKCPAVDKPVCNPDFSRTDVECVRVGKDGSVYVLR